jgi:hypothetical protein
MDLVGLLLFSLDNFPTFWFWAKQGVLGEKTTKTLDLDEQCGLLHLAVDTVLRNNANYYLYISSEPFLAVHSRSYNIKMP